MAAAKADTPPQIEVAACERIVEQVANACAAQPPPIAPSSDPLANSFAALSVAIGWGTLAIAVVTIATGIAWVFIVRHWAREEARKEVDAKLQEIATSMCDAWLSKNVPQMFRDYVTLGTPGAAAQGEGEYNADQVARNVDEST